jgi:hypothetical protein
LHYENIFKIIGFVVLVSFLVLGCRLAATQLCVLNMEKDYKKWIEMDDLKKREYNNKSWIPLCASQYLLQTGKYGYPGYEEEFFAAVSILFPIDDKEKALKCQWEDANPSHDNRPYADDEKYIVAGYFNGYDKNVTGEYLVLQQIFDTGETSEWHLAQDFVLALGLKKESDKWVCPLEDYVEVARLLRDEEGKPILLEVKTEHLKDYLCARKSGLLVSTFQSRISTQTDFAQIEFDKNRKMEKYDWGTYDAIKTDIIEGGDIAGSKVAVFHYERTDVDFEDDVPMLEGGPSDNNIKSKSWEYERKGKPLQRIAGNIWKRCWIDPSTTSPKVKGDNNKSNIMFVIDADGSKSTLDVLEEESRWLWFSPDIVNEILKRPNSYIKWHTEDTGKLATSILHSVHFGMNDIGLINVNIGDLVRMPESQLKIWASFNVTPDGKVSKELLMSQVSARPAETFSPEKDLFELLKFLNKVFNAAYNEDLFRDHNLLNEYWRRINRFKACDKDGLILLCKELRRFIIERINDDVLKKLRPSDPKELGSIKRIERMLNDFGYKGREITAPLVGINELRQADAHLPSDKLESSFKLAEIDVTFPYPIIAKRLIGVLANRIYVIASIIKEKNT